MPIVYMRGESDPPVMSLVLNENRFFLALFKNVEVYHDAWVCVDVLAVHAKI